MWVLALVFGRLPNVQVIPGGRLKLGGRARVEAGDRRKPDIEASEGQGGAGSRGETKDEAACASRHGPKEGQKEGSD